MNRITNNREKLKAIWADTSWEDVAAYIGPNAEKFRPAWEKQRNLILKKGYGFPWTLCWPALLLSFVWFFYRKQWAIGAMFVVLPTVFVIIFPGAVGGLAGVGIAIGTMAKGFYLQTAVPKIAKIGATSMDRAARTTALEAAGGTSMLAGILSGVLFAASTLAAILSVTH